MFLSFSCSSRAYWEYQRQLWDVDCIARSDQCQRRRERRDLRQRKRQRKEALELLKEKKDEEGFIEEGFIEEGSSKEEKFSQEEKSSKEEQFSKEERRGAAAMDDCTLIAVPAWGSKLVDDEQRVVVHEGRYFRAGKVGVLCVDGVGPRVRRTLGEEEQEEQGDNKEEEDQDPIGEHLEFCHDHSV